MRGSVSNARAGRRFYALVNRVVLNPVARAMGVETSAIRMELVGSQLIGLAMIRYVLKVEPIASLSVDELVPLWRRRCGPHWGCRRRPRRWTASRSSPRFPGEGQRTRIVVSDSRNPWPPRVVQRSPCLVLVQTMPR